MEWKEKILILYAAVDFNRTVVFYAALGKAHKGQDEMKDSEKVKKKN